MKNIILFVALSLFTLNIYSQKKFYLLTDVDVAPEMENYKNIDSLNSKQNFKRSLKRFIVMNLDVSRGIAKKSKVFVEFVVRKNGKVEVLRVKGKSDQAKAIVVETFNKIKKMKPAILNNVNVAMKFIYPVTLNATIIIDKTKKNRW